ncbi:globin [Endozoicomonas sp. SM1973]|uniref:Globin n=1 Tax=Spartinivicinus marinus TaxID=2994442 RepID=A0A853IKS9_9GAMM|nr:globin [Spartinivicinus marinus]MCX4025672.1 globin [Spartinivicinus marinus]NYZ68306.1 globin [Spartinivicinus marinus]
MSDFENIFDASYERVLGKEINARSFFDAFYLNFTNKSDAIARAFANTDMSKQKRLLEKSFYKLLTFYATNNATDYLEKIAIQHNRLHLNILPEWYDIWLEALVETVAQYDDEFSDNIELAWRLVLASGITYMKFKYSHVEE